MKTGTKHNNETSEAAEKRKTVKYAVIFTVVIALVFSAIWFGGELLASESVISTASVLFMEKTAC